MKGEGDGRRAINAFVSLDERFVNSIEREWKLRFPINFKSPYASIEITDKALF
jgi:hypothetical protein